MCGWCYWVNNILYYPNLLMSTAVIGTYVIGQGRDRARRTTGTTSLPATLIALWLAVVLNIVGLRPGVAPELGAMGTYIPGLLLVGLGLYAVRHPAAGHSDARRRR